MHLINEAAAALKLRHFGLKPRDLLIEELLYTEPISIGVGRVLVLIDPKEFHEREDYVLSNTTHNSRANLHPFILDARVHRQVEQVGLGVDLVLEKCHYDVAPVAGREGCVRRRRKRGSRRMRVCLRGEGGLTCRGT